jgi:ABC-type microcin C transport system permease subunit YejE
LKSVTASLLSFMMVMVAEMITVLVQTKVLMYPEEQLLCATNLLKFLYSLPPLLIIIIIAVILQIKLHRKKEYKN